jgi:hypothetical protein
MEVVLLYNKANTFGLQRDKDIITKALRKVAPGQIRIRSADPLEPPVPCDIAIHLEIPVYVWMPWCSVNILMINPEWYEEEAWESYLEHFDGVFFRDIDAHRRFQAKYPEVKSWYLRWATDDSCLPEKKVPVSVDTKDGFLWLLGASQNKRKAAERLLPLWRGSYPPVKVYSTVALDLSGQDLASNVSVHIQDLDVDARKRLAAWTPGHIVCSQAEAFGYAAAEAERHGGFLLLNNLAVYSADYSTNPGTFFIKTPLLLQDKGLARIADFEADAHLQEQLDEAIEQFLETDIAALRKEHSELSKAREARFHQEFKSFWEEIQEMATDKKATKPKHLPPVLSKEDCPPISIITLLYNRRKFFDLACHNIMLSDYPKEKIEWIIVEDSDDPNEDASDRVVQVGLKAAPLTLVYVPLEKKTPIGEKRNLGIERAKNEIIVMMDDDDHYPETSIRRRVAWLTKHPWKPNAVACTTIACYDLLRGVSAVNTPPWSLCLSQRISEATLVFRKRWWEEQRFSVEANLSEGESLLKGRESDVLEVPPQQIIVAFSHKKNTSGRRIPAEDAKPGCFWGFPKEFLIYIHKLAGVEVEEDTSGSRSRRR